MSKKVNENENIKESFATIRHKKNKKLAPVFFFDGFHLKKNNLRNSSSFEKKNIFYLKKIIQRHIGISNFKS
jgi:hypothetical protein